MNRCERNVRKFNQCRVLALCLAVSLYYALILGIKNCRQNSAVVSKWTETGEKEECQPISRIMYLKTHKTASTTIRTVIERYSEDHNLTIPVPSGVDKNLFDQHHSFKTGMVLPLLPGEERYDVIFQHLRYNAPEVKKLFPRNETFYLTAIRETGRHFESVFSYFYGVNSVFRDNAKSADRQSLSEWLDDAAKSNIEVSNMFAKNGIFHNLGFDPQNESPSYIKSAIKQLENDFDLVLVSDYFLESMVLLKDHLCWNLSDVVSLRENSRIPVDGDVDQPLSGELRAKILAWNKADATLFDHFNKTFWNKIETFGIARMKREVAILDNLNRKLVETCATEETGTMKQKERGEITKEEYQVKVFVYDWNESAKNNNICRHFMTSVLERSSARYRKYQQKKEEITKQAVRKLPRL